MWMFPCSALGSAHRLELNDKVLGHIILIMIIAIMAAYIVWLPPRLLGTLFLRLIQDS